MKRRRPKFLNLTKVGVRRRRRVEHSSIERESTQPFVAAFGPQVSPLLLLTPAIVVPRSYIESIDGH